LFGFTVESALQFECRQWVCDLLATICRRVSESLLVELERRGCGTEEGIVSLINQGQGHVVRGSTSLVGFGKPAPRFGDGDFPVFETTAWSGLKLPLCDFYVNF
jgi:hypothetical protein